MIKVRSKILIKLILPIGLIFVTGCGNSFESLNKQDLIGNESFILNEVYGLFFGTGEYMRGMGMKPQMQFDAVYVYCLNIDEKNIDFGSLSNEELKYNWDDLSIDNSDVKKMIECNIPIVQMSFHSWDPMSETGSNKWVTKTYFFPDCKMKGGRLVLGMGHPVNSRISSIKYFPYFYENPMNAPMSGGNWLNVKSNQGNVLFNGSVLKITDLVK